MNWIKSKVIMLPTEKSGNCLLLNSSNNLRYEKEYLTRDYAKTILNVTFHHLYFLSTKEDEEIKEGDWYSFFVGGSWELMQCRDSEEANRCNTHISIKDNCKKITATTDESLVLNNNTFLAKLLPQPSQDFIDVFVREYDAGRKIEEVMVEYFTKYHCKDCNHIQFNDDQCNNCSSINTFSFSELKVKPDNTISIRKIKDTWNREEVIALIKKNTERLTNSWISSDIEWIEENL